MIHVCSPYRVDKNLGKAYNEVFELISDNDYLCLHDYDVLFLMPETIAHMHEYVRLYPNIDFFTCFTNRNKQRLTDQLLKGVSTDTDIAHHIQLARSQEKYLYQVTELTGSISGFLMVISKRLWNVCKFSEQKKCIGVDFDYSFRARTKIMRMDGIYVWHTYRLIDGVHNTTHLK